MKISVWVVILLIFIELLMGCVIGFAKITGWPAAVIMIAPLAILLVLLHPEIIGDAEQVAEDKFSKRPIIQEEVVQQKPVEEIKTPVIAPVTSAPVNELDAPEVKPEGQVS